MYCRTSHAIIRLVQPTSPPRRIPSLAPVLPGPGPAARSRVAGAFCSISGACPCTTAARPEGSRPSSGGCCSPVTVDASSAVHTPTCVRPTTSSTGRWAGPPTSTIWRCCATPTTAGFTTTKLLCAEARMAGTPQPTCPHLAVQAADRSTPSTLPKATLQCFAKQAHRRMSSP